MFSRYGFVLLLLNTALLMYGCGSSGKTVSEKAGAAEVKDEKSTKTPIRPTWFSESNRMKTDRMTFYGYGMAVANDSAVSRKQAFRQARHQLRNAVGDSLEKLRKSLTASNSSNTGKFSDSDFIIKLRNATSAVTHQAVEDQLEVKRHEDSWVAFARVHIRLSAIVEQLRKSLANYPDFLKAL